MVSISQVWLSASALIAGNIIGSIFITGNFEQAFYGTLWLMTLAILLSLRAALSRASATPEGK